MVVDVNGLGPGFSDASMSTWSFTGGFAGFIDATAVCANASLFFFFGDNGQIRTSTGNLTLTTVTSPGATWIESCCWDGASAILAGGRNISTTRFIFYSTDNGATFSQVTSNMDRNVVVIRGVAGHYLALGQTGRTTRATSPGGPWTADNTGTALPFTQAYDLVWLSGISRWVASGRNNSTHRAAAAYSDDFGATWTSSTVTGGATGQTFVGIATDGTNVLMFNSDNEIYRSTDNGVNFTVLTDYSGTAFGPCNGVKFLNSQYSILEGGWGIQNTADGVTIGSVVPVYAASPAPSGGPVLDGIAFIGASAPPYVFTHVFAGA